MGFILLTDDKGCKVYRHDKVSSAGKSYTNYSLGVSSKDRNGNWTNGYLNVAFKKGVEVGNKATIKIKNAFPIVNEYNGKTSVNWMITDFEEIEKGEAVANSNDLSTAFADLGVGIDEELPFV